MKLATVSALALCLGLSARAGADRPAFGTLRGIHPGRRFPLVDPTTGRLDRAARVVSTGQDRFDRIPVATVRFTSGHEQLYAADRLHLVGQPFGVQRSHMRKLRRDVARALSAELGARADHVPVTTLRGRNTPPRPGAARPYLGPFLRAYLGDQPPGTLRELYKLEGWHDRGRTYLHRSYAAFTRTLRLHETLHALSRPFTAECRARGERSLGRGYTRLFEAITDYFAGHVAERRFGVVPDRSDGRYGSVSFGRRLADVVGHDRLRRIYLGQGAGLLDNLARAVGSEAFRRAVAHLDRGDFDAARSAASGW